MKQLESEQQFESLKQGATVFEFTAGWCPGFYSDRYGCRMRARYPMFDFVSVDRDKFMDICIENGIMGIPSFLVYKNGELLGSYIGKERKSLNG